MPDKHFRKIFLFLLSALALLLLVFLLRPTKPVPPPPKPQPQKVLSAIPEPGTTRDFMGVNVAVSNNPSEISQVAGWVRDYHKWYWYEATEGVYTWDQGWQNLTGFYDQLFNSGLKIMPVVEYFPCWASTKTCPLDNRRNGYPKPDKHSNYLKALVQKYGNKLGAVENYNEPNQWWDSYLLFPKEDFALMTAADYDGVKAVDPSMRLVLAGTARTDTTYMGAVDKNKYDVLNFHWYTTGDTISGGKNPESGMLKEEIDKMKAWRDANAPGKPIWITEFGWDTAVGTGINQGKISRIYAPELNAANYLVRAFLLMQARGIDKGFVYVYGDVSDNPEWKWSLYLSSGLVTNNAGKDGTKKPGWYYLATLKNVVGNYVFDRIVSDGPNIYHYDYQLPGTSKRAAVLWARNGERDNGYQAPYATSAAGTLVQLANGSTSGTLTATDGLLTLTEKPVILLYNEVVSTPTPTPEVLPQNTPTPTPTRTMTPTPTPTPKAMDSTPPQVTITFPKEGSNVSGRVAIAAQAMDNVRVTRVEFYINDRLLASDTSSPYYALWNTNPYRVGSYRITARAYDAAGNTALASIVVQKVKR